MSESPELFVRFLSTPRSGHHAIMNWFLAGCPQPVWFRDNITRPRDRGHLMRAAGRSGLPQVPPRKPWAGAATLAVAYERIDLAKVLRSHPVRDRGWLPECETMRDVVILRDPYNNFASQRRQWDRAPGQARPMISDSRLAGLWAALARYWIDGPGFGWWGEPPAVIIYDRWLADPAGEAERLGIRHVPEAVTAIPWQGRGSSFAGDPLAPGATLERWREFVDDPAWRAMLTREVLYAAEVLWPELTAEVMAELPTPRKSPLL